MIIKRAEGTRGECQVICFHPQHNLTVAQMSTEQVVSIVNVWTDGKIMERQIPRPTRAGF